MRVQSTFDILLKCWYYHLKSYYSPVFWQKEYHLANRMKQCFKYCCLYHLSHCVKFVLLQYPYLSYCNNLSSLTNRFAWFDVQELICDGLEHRPLHKQLSRFTFEQRIGCWTDNLFSFIFSVIKSSMQYRYKKEFKIFSHDRGYESAEFL